MESEQFWLVLLIGIVIGMLFSTGLRWLGGKLQGRNGKNKTESPDSNVSQDTNRRSPTP